jgi:uncharacterized protein involved in tolerance to divalent cations
MLPINLGCGVLLIPRVLMHLYYVTLNTVDEARQIGRALLEQQIAVCTNWFPITCAYRWQGFVNSC